MKPTLGLKVYKSDLLWAIWKGLAITSQPVVEGLILEVGPQDTASSAGHRPAHKNVYVYMCVYKYVNMYMNDRISK